MEENDNRNMILALLLSLLIMAGWFFLFGPEPAPEQGELTPAAEQALEEEASDTIMAREDAIAQDQRVAIDAARLGGSIDLKGGRIDDLVLKDYKETLAEDSPSVKLLSPQNTAQAFFAQTSYLAAEGIDADNIPNPKTEWQLKSGEALSTGAPVVLSWKAPNGVEYEREFMVDENFMFTVTDRVINTTGNTFALKPFSYVSYLGEEKREELSPRTGPKQSGFILHQGVISNIDGEVPETSFKDVRKGDDEEVPGSNLTRYNVSEKGWTGFTTKYWMATLIPAEKGAYEGIWRYVESTDTYTTEVYFEPKLIAGGETLEHTTNIYAGAKEVELIRQYRDDMDINRFDDAVDWGWFYFLTKPIFSLLHWLHGLIGNMGLSIIALTFLIKTILFPLAYRSYVSMSRMKKLQPEMEKIKESAGDDRMKLQQMTMELYRKEKVNPVAGCLPILLQIPIFFSLYKVLYVTTEMRQAPFFGPWRDLASPDPTSIWNLFGLLPWDAPVYGSLLFTIALGILPILLGISMWATQRLNPTPTEPTQAMIFRWMPWVFMFMMGGFATGLLIYWITNNTLTFIQQYTIMRTQGVKPDLLGNMFGRKNKA